MRHYCTYFDRFYAPRGLALFASMRAHLPPFRLHVLCLDPVTYELLRGIPGDELVATPLAELEAADPELAAAKPTRSTLEYYYTITPAWPRYLLRRFPDIDWLTYLDADLCFYSDPEPAFAEVADASVAITRHRTTGEHKLAHKDAYGTYNNGWMSYHRSAAALDCLDWYRERCLEWCFDRSEGDRYGDQKYLERFAGLFPGVADIRHKGVNLAYYGANDYHLSVAGERIMVDEVPLVCFHFHHLLETPSGKFTFPLRQPVPPADGVLRAILYPGYISQLKRIVRQIKPLFPDAQLARTVRHERNGGNALG